MQKNNLLKSIQKNIKIFKTVFFICCLFFYGNFASAAALNLPKDSEGWTIFTPSDDSKIMYVSADGDDSTGTIYDNNDAALGGNPFNPTGPINSFATYAAAFTHTRDGYPDWILFKRGDAFDEVIWSQVRSGRSGSEPSLIGSYGSSGLSPILHVGTVYAGYAPGPNKQWSALSGITFYSPSRDPNNVAFASIAGANGLYIYSPNQEEYIRNILIEGCRFSFMINNMISGVSVSEVDIRRSVFMNNYSADPGTSHSQGFYSAWVDGLSVTESIFDHNGWYSQAGSGGIGEATMFNHNTYFPNLKNLVMANNIFMRPSSINNKFTAEAGAASTLNATIRDNLYIDGEIAISIGGNATDILRFKDITIVGNVITNTNISLPTNRILASGIEWQDWDGGAITGNYIINSDMLNAGPPLSHLGTSRNVIVDNNTVYGVINSYWGSLRLNADRGSDVSGFVFSNNKIQIPESSGYTIRTEYDPIEKWEFLGNKYYSNRSDGTRFRLNGSDVTDAQWETATGDTSTFEQIIFPDPTRSVETYMASLGEAPTLESFYEKCREQDRYNWDSRFIAEPVNAYIKAGFATATFRADVDGSSQITTTDALLTLRNSLGLSMNGTAWQASATTGDVNCDGVSNSTDALLILRYSLGLNMSETGWCE